MRPPPRFPSSWSSRIRAGAGHRPVAFVFDSGFLSTRPTRESPTLPGPAGESPGHGIPDSTRYGAGVGRRCPLGLCATYDCLLCTEYEVWTTVLGRGLLGLRTEPGVESGQSDVEDGIAPAATRWGAPGTVRGRGVAAQRRGCAVLSPLGVHFLPPPWGRGNTLETSS